MTTNLFDMILAQENKKKTAKQQKVIETSIKLFAEKGYANTSTAEIAKVAEVSEATIFKHYGTKDNLLLSIMLPFMKNSSHTIAHEAINEVLLSQDTNFEQFLRGFLKNRVDFICEHKEVFQVLVKEILYKDELKREMLPYIARQVLPIFNNVVGEFKRRGDLVDKPTDQIVNVLLTLLGGFFVSRFLLFDNYFVSDEEIENIVRFAMDGLGDPVLTK